MSADTPTVLALDFDGVLCDGMKEYFQTAWQAYCTIWQPANPTPPDGLAERFYQVRPLIATGWEMPVLLRALLTGMTQNQMKQDWQAVSQQILQHDGLQPAQLSAEVDGVRDRWIAADLDSWLAEQYFYPGVVQQLQRWTESPLKVTIISTKEGRFIQQLLRKNAVDAETLQIFGKEVKQSKPQILRTLIADYGEDEIVWFVEDRLQTLQAVHQQPDLQTVGLFLADWGYNLPEERASIAHDPAIQLLSLNQFGQDFSKWQGQRND
jgi:phosphoglycolate phosphatase-like HAD superfamily hydrolase